MGKQESNPLRVQRLLWLLEYLRKYSAPEHPVQLRDIDTYFKEQDMGQALVDKKTRHKQIKDLAKALNNDRWDHPLEWKESRICYDEIAPGAKKRKSGYSTITNLFYRHEFTDEEIDELEEGILFLPTLKTAQRMHLIRKVEEHLAPVFHRTKTAFIQTLYRPAAVDQEQLYDNLSLLQEAIQKKRKIRYQFNGYDRLKRLVPVRTEPYTMSPYYIAAYGGRYYLLGVTDGYSDLSVWRVDLMSGMEITDQTARRKQDAGVPARWDEKFPYEHLNMFFDQPEEITLRVRNKKRSADPDSALRPGYTFLYDWFGPTFRYIRTEEGYPYDDIVKVRCSPEAMVHWALQYSDRVEVLEPEDLREQIAGKIRDLEKKYLDY